MSAELESFIRKMDRMLFPVDKPIEIEDLEDSWWWVVKCGDIIVGYAALSKSLNAGRGFLSRAGITPIARGHHLQRRLIKVRERQAKAVGWTCMLTYTSLDNIVSSNNLIACGYKLWSSGDSEFLHWYKDL